MERIERFEALEGLLSAQLRRGVFTNCFLSRGAYEREIGRGLRVHAFPGGLLLFRDREDHDLLNLYLQPDAEVELPGLARPAVVELAWKPRDAEAAASVLRRLQKAGFAGQFRRRRYGRPADSRKGARDAAVFCPGTDRLGAVLQFLTDQFDRLSGCIPTADELCGALRSGAVLATEDADGMTGLLHFARERAFTEIRHLAVRGDCRGRGIAGMLMNAYLAETAHQKSQVWARQGNTPAERVYEKYQYRPDGWESAVLTAGGKDEP